MNLNFRVTETQDAKKLMKRYENLMKKLGVFEEEIFENWVNRVPDIIETNLKTSMMMRDNSTKLLILNFSPELFSILREVHYLRLMEKQTIPEVALDFSEKSETYRNYTLNLERTIEWYNRIRKTCTTVELELIQDELDTIDVLVTRAIDELNWNSDNILEYLKELRKPVECLQGRMQKIQGNLQEIRNTMSAWAKLPLFERKEGRKDTVLSLDERPERKTKRYGEIEVAAERVHQ